MSRHVAGPSLRKKKSDSLPQSQDGPDTAIVSGVVNSVNLLMNAVVGFFGDNERGAAGSKNRQYLPHCPAQTHPAKRGDSQSNSNQPSQSRPHHQPYAHLHANHSAQSHAHQSKLRDGGTLEARLPERRAVALPHENHKHWDRVKEGLDGGVKNMTTVEELQTALSYYNAHAERCTFEPLRMALDAPDMHHFFKDTLPFIIGIALELPSLFKEPLALLLPEHNATFYEPKSLFLSHRQLACLLANIFLCTFERGNPFHTQHVQGTACGRDAPPQLSGIDCLYLFGFEGDDAYVTPNSAEKLKCLLHYFFKTSLRPFLSSSNSAPSSRGVGGGRGGDYGGGGEGVGHAPGGGSICRTTASRMDWLGCEERLSDVQVEVKSEGVIEDVAPGVWEADFANAHVGGGVLGRGCVQEEIRFLIAPELIASKVFASKLECHESMLICGSEIFSKHSGYRATFRWEGDMRDGQAGEAAAQSVITVFDALYFAPHDYAKQFADGAILRELNKAASAFAPFKSGMQEEIATGNWGCGAFGGDVYLKFVIQILAAARAGRSLIYFTFGDAALAEKCSSLFAAMSVGKLTVGVVASRLMELSSSGALRKRTRKSTSAPSGMRSSTEAQDGGGGGGDKELGLVLFEELKAYAASLKQVK